MTTRNSVLLPDDNSWVLVYDSTVDGTFSGAIQNNSGKPVVARVSEDNPSSGQGGASIGNFPVGILINQSLGEKLYCRAPYGGNVILC